MHLNCNLIHTEVPPKFYSSESITHIIWTVLNKSKISLQRCTYNLKKSCIKVLVIQKQWSWKSSRVWQCWLTNSCSFRGAFAATFRAHAVQDNTTKFKNYLGRQAEVETHMLHPGVMWPGWPLNIYLSWLRMGGVIPPVLLFLNGHICSDNLMAHTHWTHCHNVTNLYMPNIYFSKKEDKTKAGRGQTSNM
jgi:hypothetical protein